MRVLVVEDDADLNRQLSAALREAGYTVDTAADGEEGHFLGDQYTHGSISSADRAAHGVDDDIPALAVAQIPAHHPDRAAA